ncbi:uncharacterized protein [Dendrobates tinctorius]|uniref:uncharacterized protein n=1 Tax=Dendrobates tinctorius TaxID=92724 RepID=UPI003CC9BDE1
MRSQEVRCQGPRSCDPCLLPSCDLITGPVRTAQSTESSHVCGVWLCGWRSVLAAPLFSMWSAALRVEMKRELQALTEKQNLMLSNRLSAIRQSNGRVDNWNFYPQRSLNATQQRQNFNKISYENGKILERILRRESEYGRWESEWEKVKRIQANISRYPQVTWAGEHRVTFMDYKRNMDIPPLFEGNETASTQSRSTIKLDSISKGKDSKRTSVSSNHTENRKGSSLIQVEELVNTESEDKEHCYLGQRSPYKICKRGTATRSKSEKSNNKDQEISPLDQKSFSKSKHCANCFTEITSGGREQDDLIVCKHSTQEEGMSVNSQLGMESRAKLKNARSTMSFEGSDETFDSSQESDASSCYSFQGSEESSPPCSTQTSELAAETMSSRRINLKTRMTSSSSTSIRSVKSPEGSSHKLNISNMKNIYRGHDPSSQQSSTTSIRHPETPVTSFHRLEVSKEKQLYGSLDMSLLESKESYCDLQQSTNRYTEASERTATSSPESIVIYPQKWPM